MSASGPSGSLVVIVVRSEKFQTQINCPIVLSVKRMVGHLPDILLHFFLISFQFFLNNRFSA